MKTSSSDHGGIYINSGPSSCLISSFTPYITLSSRRIFKTRSLWKEETCEKGEGKF